MAETPADVRRDIELTRERISDTLQQLEAKANLMQIVKDHPWPALGLAVGAGFLLSGSRADVKAAGATLVATKGASSKLGTVLDDVVANLMGGISLAFQQRVESLVDEVKTAIGAPTGTHAGTPAGAQRFGATGTAAEYGASHATAGMAAATSNSGAASSTGMGALGNATQGGSGSLTPSTAGSQGTGARNRGDDVGTMGGAGSWAPRDANADQVQGLGGTPGAMPRAD